MKYGSISSPGNSILPMCLLCNKTLLNDSMKPSNLKEHLMKIQSGKKIKIYCFFQAVKEKYLKTPSLQQFMMTTSKRDYNGLILRLIIFYTSVSHVKNDGSLQNKYTSD